MFFKRKKPEDPELLYDELRSSGGLNRESSALRANEVRRLEKEACSLWTELSEGGKEKEIFDLFVKRLSEQSPLTIDKIKAIFDGPLGLVSFAAEAKRTIPSDLNEQSIGEWLETFSPPSIGEMRSAYEELLGDLKVARFLFMKEFDKL